MVGHALHTTTTALVGTNHFSSSQMYSTHTATTIRIGDRVRISAEHDFRHRVFANFNAHDSLLLDFGIVYVVVRDGALFHRNTVTRLRVIGDIIDVFFSLAFFSC